MKPSVQENVQQLQSLVSLVVKMIQDDLPDSTSICNQDSMTLGDFKKRFDLTKQDVSAIKLNQPVSNELIKLDLCEKVIKYVKEEK